MDRKDQESGTYLFAGRRSEQSNYSYTIFNSSRVEKPFISTRRKVRAPKCQQALSVFLPKIRLKAFRADPNFTFLQQRSLEIATWFPSWLHER